MQQHRGLTGLAVGWRPTTSVAEVLAGFGVALLFSYALTWMNACLGMSVSGAESAQGIVFIVIFPLAFVSNVFVPTQGMPSWLQAIANWNPVSAVASACRVLFGNPNPSGAIQAWPMQHPVEAAVIWSLAILAVAVPLAGRLYQAHARLAQRRSRSSQRILMERSWASQQRRADFIRHPDGAFPRRPARPVPRPRGPHVHRARRLTPQA